MLQSDTKMQSSKGLEDEARINTLRATAAHKAGDGTYTKTVTPPDWPEPPTNIPPPPSK